MSQNAAPVHSWSVRGFQPQGHPVSQPTAASSGSSRLHTGKRWHPNPQNPYEVQLRKKIDLKWEREKRRRQKKRAEQANRGGGNASTVSGADGAEPASSCAKPEPLPAAVAIEEQTPKAMPKPKKEKKAKKEKKSKAEKMKSEQQTDDDDVKPGVSQMSWKEAEEWAEEMTKEWLAQPVSSQGEKDLKDLYLDKEREKKAMFDGRSDPVGILVEIGN